MKIPIAHIALAIGLLCTGASTLVAQTPVETASSNTSSPTPPPATSSYPSDAEGGPVPPADCGDALSEALDAQPNTLPCWSNIRAVDRWNTTQIPDGNGKYATGFHLSDDKSANLSVVLGSLAATDVTSDPAPHGYGGIAGVSGLIDQAHWQMMFEDAGGGAALSLDGANNPAGINRAAVRAVGEINPRLLWQGSITNTYGTDSLRLFAPLDYRQVGDAQVVVADAVAYGLHEGRVTDEEEDAKLRYESSRRSNWDLAFGHTLQAYSDDGALIQTERGRLEFLRAISPNLAIGIYGTAERQDGPSPCSLAGLGLRSLANWKSRATLSISGAASAASQGCGNNAVFTGDVSFSAMPLKGYSFFVGVNRGLSGGVIEHTVLLNSLTAGVQHQFRPGWDVTLSAAGIRGTDPITPKTYSGSFEALAFAFPVSTRFVLETSVRHFQVSPASLRDNRVILISTLWFNPRRRSDSR
jgi:hypothetical protein